jgi:glucosamine--fructose-6-phosphate aminotransferase (isomerizing)
MAESFATNIPGQPDALRRLLGARAQLESATSGLAPAGADGVLFVGSGTSRYAGEMAVQLASALGIRAACMPSLPCLQALDRLALGPNVLVVAISQSGGTRTLVEVVRGARERGSRTVAVTADPSSALARAADVIADSRTGAESLYAKTRGFVTTAVAAAMVATSVARGLGRIDAYRASRIRAGMDALPSLLEGVIDRSAEVVPDAAARFASVTGLMVVGSGHQWPAAREGALKILEVAKVLVASFELEESLHGPFNAVAPDLGVVLVAGEIPQRERLAAFVRAVREVGAPLLIVADGGLEDALGQPVDVVLPVASVPELSPVLGIAPLQVLAGHLARMRGADPDATRYPQLYAIFATKEGQD